MKLRELLEKIDLKLRPLPGKGAQSIDTVDADAVGVAHGSAPVNWVPSQQDERPH